jgi:RNA-directed DNA polymerase
MTKSTEEQPVAVPETAKRPGETLRRWYWVEPTVWTERMLTALD